MDIYEKTTMVGRVSKHLKNFSNRLNNPDNHKPTDEEIEEVIADHEKDLINNMLTDKFQKIENINIPENAALNHHINKHEFISNITQLEKSQISIYKSGH